jgi:hypothetical protein
MTKPTKRTIERDRDPAAPAAKTQAEPERPIGAQKIDELDSEDAAGAYAEPGSPGDTGETDLPIEPAPHARPPAKRRKKS